MREKIILFFKLAVFYSLKKLESATLDLDSGEGILAVVSSEERKFSVEMFLKDQMQSWWFAMFACLQQFEAYEHLIYQLE